MGFLITQSVSMNDPTKISQDCGSIGYSGDSSSHTWKVSVNNADTFMSGKSASVLFILPSGVKIMQSATVSGTTATITFGQAVYADAGQVTAFMQIVDSTNSTTTTIAVLRFIVVDCASGEIHVPEDVVMPIKDLKEKYIELNTAYEELNTAYGQLALNADEINTVCNSLDIDTDSKTINPADGYSFGGFSGIPVIQYGTTSAKSINTSAWMAADTYVTLTGFTKAPSVVMTAIDVNNMSTKVYPVIKSITESQFTYNAFNTGSSANPSSVKFSWIAIGE